MRSAKSIGRIVGILLFVQLVGLTLPFVLLMPIVGAGFLENAAGIAFQIRLAVLLFFANGALTIGIAIYVFPFLREYSARFALSFLAVSVSWFVTQSVDNVYILSMLSLSQQYAESGAANPDLFHALGAALRSTRKWAHYTELLVIDAWMFALFASLYRSTLVPRALAAFGLLMVVIHAAGIPLPVFFGYSSVPPMGFSLALSQIALILCLVVKGFKDRGEVSEV